LEQLTTFRPASHSRAPTVVAFLSMVDRRRRLHRELVEYPATFAGLT
jgi:hypothetical protein